MVLGGEPNTTEHSLCGGGLNAQTGMCHIKTNADNTNFTDAPEGRYDSIRLTAVLMYMYLPANMPLIMAPTFLPFNAPLVITVIN